MEYQSSPIKWCEGIYQYSDYIAEFWNTITSMSFTIFAIYGYHIHSKYKFGKLNVSRNLWFLSGLIGPTSMIFHATLSFFGQFIDEVSVMVYLFYCMKIIHKNTNFEFFVYTTLSVLITWYMPFISPFILITLGYFLADSTRNILSYCNESKHLWNRGYLFGLISVALWIMDWVCIINTHSWWHITITLCIYNYNLVMIKELTYGSKGSDNIKIIYSKIPYLIEEEKN